MEIVILNVINSNIFLDNFNEKETKILKSS